MSNTYQNPTSLLPKNDFEASGPLAGALAGLQTMYGIGGIEAGQRDSDLSYLDTLNKYQNTMLDNPWKEQERLAKLYENKDKVAQYEEGIPQKVVRSKAKTELSIDDLKRVANESQKRIIAATDVDSAMQAMTKAKQQAPLAQDPDYLQNMWSNHREILNKQGVKVPDKWGPQAEAILNSHYQAAKVKLPYYQDIIKKFSERSLLSADTDTSTARQLEGVKYTADKAANTRTTTAADKLEEKALGNPFATLALQIKYMKEGSDKFDPDRLKAAITELVERAKPKIDEQIFAAKRAGKNITPTVEDYLNEIPPFYRTLLIDNGFMDDFKREVKDKLKVGGEASSTKPSIQSKQPPNTVKVEKDGKQYYLPKSQRDQAEKEGYKIINE